MFLKTKKPFEAPCVMPQALGYLHLSLQSSKLVKSCLFLFLERRSLSSSKVKQLQFLIKHVLYLVRFSKNIISKVRIENV